MSISKPNKSFKKITIAVLFLAMFNLAIAVASPSISPSAYAAGVCDHLDAGSEAYRANGCGGTSGSDLSNVIVSIVNAVIGAVGLIAAIFVLIGGINYMTSAGDPGKVEKAKKTILYALIGLIIAALTFAIVNFVIRILG